MAFLHLLGRVLFVLIFVITGYEKLAQPANFIPIYADRYKKFEQFLGSHQIKLPPALTFSQIEPKLPTINQLVAYEMITFGIGVLCFVPYMSLGLFAHLVVFTLVMNNPLYYLPESKEYFHEIEQVVLSIASMGICLMFCGGSRGGKKEEERGEEKGEQSEEEKTVPKEKAAKKEGKQKKTHKRE